MFYSITRIWIGGLTAAALVACGAQSPTATPSAAPTKTATPLPTALPSPTAVPPTPTDTLAPTALPAPTATALPPTAVPQPPSANAIPVSFAPGGTSAVVEGDVPANGSLTYSLHLLGGQYFQVSIESPITQAALGVSGADGTLLVSPAASAKFWQGTLPNTQDYYFQVVSTGPASHVVVSFIAPAPLVFAPGGTSIVVEGSVEANQTQYYAIQAQAGQLMQVMLDSPNQGVLLTIYGIQDGQPLNETKKWLWF